MGGSRADSSPASARVFLDRMREQAGSRLADVTVPVFPRQRSELVVRVQVERRLHQHFARRIPVPLDAHGRQDDDRAAAHCRLAGALERFASSATAPRIWSMKGSMFSIGTEPLAKMSPA